MAKKYLFVFLTFVLTSQQIFSQQLSKDERMNWWRAARFGMFIHWGVYSVPAGNYQGHRVGHIGEWIMNRGKIPVAEYQKYASEFDPEKFNAEDWVRMAKEAGMKYIVITAKHHDGFAMFKTKASKWNIVDATPYGKDVLKQMAAACKKYGIKLGFYYSQAQDWNNPGGAAARKSATEGWANPDSAKIDAYTAAHSGHWDPAQTTKTMAQYINDVAVPQVRELLTNYGKVAVLWWDTPTGMTDEFAQKLHALLKLQPGIISNDRLKRPDFPGDYKTPEQRIPNRYELAGKDWETCMTMNETWGYKSYANNWKSTKTLVRNLIDIASKGGNYLLNVGPKPDGTFPQESIDRLREIGKWMKVNGEAIYDTKASPLQPLPWGRCTQRQNANNTTLYLSVFNWPDDGKLVVPGVNNKVISAKLLAGDKTLKAENSSVGIAIKLPAEVPDTTASVIELVVKGKVADQNEVSPMTIVKDSLSKYILTPGSGPKPRINGAKIFGVRPDHPIIFTIPATGLRPMTFSAEDLPEGVKLDAENGRLSGSLKTPGEYTITFHARNKLGEASEKLKLVVGEDIALTPPMGWNSWNVYASKVTQALVAENARAMVSSGLINHGWTYMNIDDVWQGKRGGRFGGILPDSSTFPDMQALVDEIHYIGLKAGIYSTPWVESYGHHIGGSASNPEGLFEKTKEKIPRNKKILPYAIGKYTFWDKDVKQWAYWGFDYLKYDWNPAELPETKSMYDDLRASGRDIILSLSNSIPFASIGELSKVSNSWRTGGDIRDNWKSLKSRLLTQDKWAPYARPGHWNDPDMMIVGWLGWGKGPRPSHLTPDEQYSHVSAWCLMSVPLLLGCDLTKLDEFTLSLLTNDEVLAVNQDPLGRQATVVSRQDSCGVLAKDMADGSKAAGLFNLTDTIKRKILLKWSALGIQGKYVVRDLWRQKDLGVFEGQFSAEVNPHGVVMVRLRKAKQEE